MPVLAFSVPLDSAWMDETMLVRNGEQLHRLLSDHRARIRAVFFGHVHSPTQQLRDGVLYASAGSVTMQLPGWPGSIAAKPSSDPLSLGNYVRIEATSVLIKTIWNVC